MNNPNYIQIIVLLLFVGFSVLSWVFRKLREQAQIRRVQVERERRQMEMLRTGRPGESELQPAAAGSDADRLRDLAARRQAQLQELRRRAQDRLRSVPTEEARPGREPPPLVFIPGTSGPTVPQRPTPRQQTRPRGSPVPASARPQVPPRSSRPAPVQDQRRRQPQPPRRRPDEGRRTAPAAPAPAPRVVLPAPAAAIAPIQTPPSVRQAPGVSGSSLDPRGMSTADWRRAMVINEILSTPVSLRESASGPGPLPL